MGRITRDLGAGVTKYYWYPGQKSDWVKTGIAVGSGVAAFVMVLLVTDNSLVAATVGSALTTGLGGAFLGRRDVTALQEFHDMAAERRAAVIDSGRAAWRGTVQGFVCAAAAVFVFNMPQTGFVADWLLPIVPAVVGALAHTGGMVYERMVQMGGKSNKDGKALEPTAGP
ncbi:MAG TPA: hypothetical protein H9881_13425 [Candidatus Stackebrandtia excrementipullorum]|nr:hypothetical protein [Candidatus Stackebrandtia excrementipullorum]